MDVNGRFAQPGMYEAAQVTFPLGDPMEMDRPFIVLRSRFMSRPDVLVLDILVAVREEDTNSGDTENAKSSEDKVRQTG